MFEDIDVFDLNITQDIHTYMVHCIVPLLGCAILRTLFTRTIQIYILNFICRFLMNLFEKQ